MTFLKNRFGVGLEDWFDKVVYPAFAQNFTTVWGTAIPE
jgi:hypothetical protein